MSLLCNGFFNSTRCRCLGLISVSISVSILFTLSYVNDISDYTNSFLGNV